MSVLGNRGQGRRALGLATMIVIAGAALAPARAAVVGDDPPDAPLRAGAAMVDATWHVGASAGQYASDGAALHEGHVDPSTHSTRRAPSYGTESRSFVRALVLEGASGERFAVVSNDLYIPQTLVNARVATLLEDRDRRIAAGLETGPPTHIDMEHLAVSVSHSHSSPYYSTPSWGVWAFEDVFDVRFFEYVAERMAEAIVAATDELAPATMGAGRAPFSATRRHSFGPAVADDGTPAGYPETDGDRAVDVVRFDRADGSGAIATWAVFGLHPEMLDGNDLLTGEYVGVMQTLVERAGGGVTMFTQNDTGTSEPARDGRAHAPEDRAEFSHAEYAQMHRAGALLADAVMALRADIAAGRTAVPPTDDVPFGVATDWYAPPGARALPTVSSCRTEQAFAGNPGVPLAGLPDCVFPVAEIGADGAVGELGLDPRVTYDMARAAGVPVPDNTGVPSLTGLQESAAVPLQALRLGPVGVTFCPCEQWADQSRNIRSRLDRVDDNLWLGFDWTAQTTPAGRDWCVEAGDGTWTCGDPRTKGATDLPPVDDLAIARMQAQVGNDAAGWDDPANAAVAESDPLDPAAIWGNYTHEELTDDDSFDGFDMVITAGMTNDYWGYIATYREFQRGDHYRKALTGLGPHSSDFLATRLSRLAASLAGFDGMGAGDDPLRRTAKDDAYAAVEPERIRQTARAIGEAARALVPAYAAVLPADGGAPAVTAQPTDVSRFQSAQVDWVGGANWFDQPQVAVERLDPGTGTWTTVGDQRLEVQTRVWFPEVAEVAAYRAGQHPWRWQARFEAFSSERSWPDAAGSARSTTPEGTYRFVIDGVRHAGAGITAPYHLTSAPFEVTRWRGLTVDDLSTDGATVSFAVGPRTNAFGDPAYEVGPIDYPDTATSSFTFMNGTRTLHTYGLADKNRHQQFCFHCSFGSWADAGAPTGGRVMLLRATRPPITAPVSCTSGFCTATIPPGLRGEVIAVQVPADGIHDATGNTNGQASPVVPVS